MAALFFFGVAVLVCQVQSQCVPRLPLPTIQQPQPVVAPPVVATTIIDNSVSNSLANALQLLIVSSLIQNTLNCPKIGLVCDPVPGIQCVDITPEIIKPIVSYDPIYPTCDTPYVYPCEGIDIRPCFPEVSPIIPNFSCEYPNFIPNVGCEYPNYVPNIGYDYPNIACDYVNVNPNIGCDCGNFIPNNPCGCNNFIPNFGCDYPNVIPNVGCNNIIPNLNCGSNNLISNCDCNYYPNIGYEYINPQFGPICDSVPVAAEVLFPSAIPAQLSCNLGYMPSLPCVNDPWASFVEPCGCGKPYGNGFYY